MIKEILYVSRLLYILFLCAVFYTLLIVYEPSAHRFEQWVTRQFTNWRKGCLNGEESK